MGVKPSKTSTGSGGKEVPASWWKDTQQILLTLPFLPSLACSLTFLGLNYHVFIRQFWMPSPNFSFVLQRLHPWIVQVNGFAIFAILIVFPILFTLASLFERRFIQALIAPTLAFLLLGPCNLQYSNCGLNRPLPAKITLSSGEILWFLNTYLPEHGNSGMYSFCSPISPTLLFERVQVDQSFSHRETIEVSFLVPEPIVQGETVTIEKDGLLLIASSSGSSGLILELNSRQLLTKSQACALDIDFFAPITPKNSLRVSTIESLRGYTCDEQPEPAGS